MLKNTSVNGLKLVAGDLNSRLNIRLPGEEEVLEEFVYAAPLAPMVLGSNRELLFEMCFTHDMFVANSGCERPDAERVTYRRPGVTPMADISPNLFSELDLFLIGQSQAQCVLNVKSIRSEVLASHHFTVDNGWTSLLRLDPGMIYVT